MSASNLAPTKSNLLRTREVLSLAEEGFELLERKREILMLELMSGLAEARILERDIKAAVGEAYPIMRRYLLAGGLERAREAAAGIAPEFGVVARRAQSAGVSSPALEAVPAERILQSGPLDSSADSDELSFLFSRLMRLLVDMASLRSVVLALAQEMRKTRRRVNALEKRVIPEAKEARAFITASLEEREREAVFSTKLLKSRMGRGGGR